MFLLIERVLTPQDAVRAHTKALALPFEDGARTAGPTARAVKRNLQADLSSAAGVALETFVIDAVRRHPLVKAAARPKTFSRLLISRTGPDGGYGRHIDNAIQGEGEGGLRTDLSFTLWLSDPDTYQGGALAIELAGGTHRFREAPGNLVLYPSGALHEVETVTSGERLVAVGWIESRVRDAGARETLFDLERVRAALPEDEARLLLDKAISNLLRRWAD
jgi:PKHD-type hydroxylase